MNLRERLNAAQHQQAVDFAQHFAKEEKAEFLQESLARQAFEEQHILQKKSENRPLVKLGVFALLAVLGISMAVYWQTGRYQAVEQGSAEFTAFQETQRERQSNQRNDDYILTLQNRLRENPNDGDVWFELAQAYSLNNEFENALIAFGNAEKVLGETAAILGGMATVEYYRTRHQMTPQVEKWVKLALEKDPKESASLLLLASDAFLKNEFAAAIGYWETALESEHQALDKREIIKSIQLAKQLLNAK